MRGFQGKYYLVWVLPFAAVVYYFLDFAGSFSLYRDIPRKAGAIVVLTGGSNRIEAGLSLLRRGLGKTLILSGVEREAELDSIFLEGLAQWERRAIVLEKNSRNTRENAREVGRILKDADSVILVTSFYHMKRALFVFRKTMPDMPITPYAVESANLKPGEWWKGKGAFIAVAEFLKYHAYRAYFSF